MKTKILFVALLAVCLTTTQARIGETDGELTKRYGDSYRTIKVDGDAVLVRSYHFNGFDIDATIMNGRSQIEAYAKEDKAKISGEDILALMRANLGGTPCGKPGKVDNGTKLVLLCGDRSVVYDAREQKVTIYSNDAMKDVMARLQAQDQKKLSGF